MLRYWWINHRTNGMSAKSSNICAGSSAGADPLIAPDCRQIKSARTTFHYVFWTPLDQLSKTVLHPDTWTGHHSRTRQYSHCLRYVDYHLYQQKKLSCLSLSGVVGSSSTAWDFGVVLNPPHVLKQRVLPTWNLPGLEPGLSAIIMHRCASFSLPCRVSQFTLSPHTLTPLHQVSFMCEL